MDKSVSDEGEVTRRYVPTAMSYSGRAGYAAR